MTYPQQTFALLVAVFHVHLCRIFLCYAVILLAVV